MVSKDLKKTHLNNLKEIEILQVEDHKEEEEEEEEEAEKLIKTSIFRKIY